MVPVVAGGFSAGVVFGAGSCVIAVAMAWAASLAASSLLAGPVGSIRCLDSVLSSCTRVIVPFR